MKVFKIIIPKQILLLLLLVFILSIGRIIIFGSYSLIYILWNIFLALLPFFISAILLRHEKEKKITKTIFTISIILWLLLLPNAPYLVTDLIHIGGVYNVPALYDVFLLFSSAWVGLLLGMNSIFHIEGIFKMRYSKNKTDKLIIVIMLLTSFGVYLGRFLRFNSWDIFINHFSIYKSIGNILFNSTIRIETLLYTSLFFIFLYLVYYSWKYTQIR